MLDKMIEQLLESLETDDMNSMERMIYHGLKAGHIMCGAIELDGQQLQGIFAAVRDTTAHNLRVFPIGILYNWKTDTELLNGFTKRMKLLTDGDGEGAEIEVTLESPEERIKKGINYQGGLGKMTKDKLGFLLTTKPKPETNSEEGSTSEEVTNGPHIRVTEETPLRETEPVTE